MPGSSPLTVWPSSLTAQGAWGTSGSATERTKANTCSNVAALAGAAQLPMTPLLLSVPVIFWASWIFFDGAFRALRARTLDMMVLVAVAVAPGCGSPPPPLAWARMRRAISASTRWR